MNKDKLLPYQFVFTDIYFKSKTKVCVSGVPLDNALFFQPKKMVIVLQKRMLWYSVEAPWQGASN